MSSDPEYAYEAALNNVDHVNSIAWSECRLNPMKGCTKCSPECGPVGKKGGCYSPLWAWRHTCMGTDGYENVVTRNAITGVSEFTGRVNVVPKEYGKIRKFKSGMMVFVNSMSDTFHKEVPSDELTKLFDGMNSRPDVIFQILTKRSARMAEMNIPVHKNIWMGVTCGCKASLYRLDDLRRVNAKTRWVSVEPLLEELDLSPWLADGTLQWVVVGGQSGATAPQHRLKISWVKKIKDDCQRYGVAFFFKQWSGVRPKTQTPYPPVLDGQIWHQYPGDAANPVDQANR
ncbi:conserved protein of unknown function （putative Bacteriophage protein gp37&|uniref:DUF5131 family protein n=1 Tax=Magnetospirillum sp. XM-1 TaxID=1663591 RepID=UPI00073DCD1E|nr:DUF5131 family protein [Magnetospirillum sp. XM-1]CUW37534.1 conserved protein of unknown function \